MHTEIVRGLRIRHASLFDQTRRLKLELSCKLPPLHDPPPVPPKHLTRCLRDWMQAILPFSTLEVFTFHFTAKLAVTMHQLCLINKTTALPRFYVSGPLRLFPAQNIDVDLIR